MIFSLTLWGLLSTLKVFVARIVCIAFAFIWTWICAFIISFRLVHRVIDESNATSRRREKSTSSRTYNVSCFYFFDQRFLILFKLHESYGLHFLGYLGVANPCVIMRKKIVIVFDRFPCEISREFWTRCSSRESAPYCLKLFCNQIRSVVAAD